MSSDFLAEMAASSRERVAVAKRTCSEASLLDRARATPLPPPLQRSPQGFDLIAELKLRSPAAGLLKPGSEDVEARVTAYARAGAAAVSVLTEPSRFDGSMAHLELATRVLAPLGVPAMRKDFLVDPYQVIEARAAGAGGVLVILRMLSKADCGALIECARELGLFVLLEAFDEQDIEVMQELVEAHVTRRRAGGAAVGQPDPARGADAAGRRDTAGGDAALGRADTARGARERANNAAGGSAGCPALQLLAGVNSRDLTTLQVVPQRLEALAHLLPRVIPRVAESGVGTPEDAQRVAAAGYEVALVGSALMQGGDPGALAAAMLQTGRAARRDAKRFAAPERAGGSA